MSREPDPAYEGRLSDAPRRKNATEARYVVVLNADEVNLVLYNTVNTPNGQSEMVVAIEKESRLGQSDLGLAGLVYGMKKEIDKRVKAADDLQKKLNCEVRLVNLNT